MKTSSFVRRFVLSFFFVAFAGASGHVNAKQNSRSDISIPQGGKEESASLLFVMVNSLADFKIFWKTSAYFENVLDGYCERTKLIKDEYEVVLEFRCEKNSGINTIRLNSKEHGGEPNRILYLVIDFDFEKLDLVKNVARKKLGSMFIEDKENIRWKSRADKKLNIYGNPVISITNNKIKKKASFDLVLEQGP